MLCPINKWPSLSLLFRILSCTALQTGQPHYLCRLLIVQHVPTCPDIITLSAQPLPGSKFLIAPTIWNSLPAHLRQPTSPTPSNGLGLLAFSSPTIPGTAQNASVPSILPTWLWIDSHQCSRPPSFTTWLSPHAFVSDDGCSTTVGFGEELVPPLMPWLTYLLTYKTQQ